MSPPSPTISTYVVSEREHEPEIRSPPVIIANPGPLGLCAFALTTLILSFMNAGISVNPAGPNQLIISVGLAYGGLVQVLAGMWAFRTGNTFEATAFSSYGGFWISFAVILIPGFGVVDAYTSADAIHDLENALGIYLMSWAFFTFLMLIAAHRTNVALVSMFASLTITFTFLSAAKFSDHIGLQKAGGSFGVLTALLAWYNALAGMLTPETSLFQLPVGPLNRVKSVKT
ncbi:GPR1/FUN34/yaaH family-domain-containing protein [Blyttiomyces helicus]|uniref:GPR1/FUN34/yaaH family-domain-containing protein n=1 Tax=Blyttiomyces helicus TaxID=388810 RepID=A0A4P9W1X0_9FUNG|nr:GPR1/FUN34/yaaH family-domain-containing protein [Blyttiomyces helicus]|eukprot:RKO85163.1 GPR1/FUN34/yaaH family-domain-containing protein [Blyttiomyces helicus]